MGKNTLFTHKCPKLTLFCSIFKSIRQIFCQYVNSGIFLLKIRAIGKKTRKLLLGKTIINNFAEFSCINDQGCMNIAELRREFPVLSRKLYGREMVYFDNAATAQRPVSVTDEWNRISLSSNANIHRAVHTLAEEATVSYEKARERIREYLNASSREEIIFTSGATASINTVAYSFCDNFLNEGDEIIVSEEEHHSNLVPWQMMCRKKHAVLKVLPVDDTGHLRTGALKGMLSSRTRLVAVTHISNVLGIVNPVGKIIEICHASGVPVLVDGAQGIVHRKVDVSELDCDFYAFSGHKAYAVPGTGVLYGKKKWLDIMPPFMFGGEMVATVSFENTTFAPLPLKFEAGTQNFAGNATFLQAIDFLEKTHDPSLLHEEDEVKSYLYDTLLSFKGLRLFGTTEDMDEKIPLFSFTVDGVHHEDLALILDKMGIAVRSGQMCAEPLMNRFGVTGMTRISLGPYNTLEEAGYFIDSLHRAVAMLG